MLANTLLFQEQSFSWDFMGMWRTMGIPGKRTVIALLVMAAWSIRYTIDHALKFSAARK
jgi:hypothetical protein